MNNDLTGLFTVVITGKQSGTPDKWKQTPLTINSTWDVGSDQEKFEVLAAIRRTYNPENKANIRGSQGQTPSQIGRCEGFKELKYERSAPSSPSITIVPSVMQYLRLVPQTTVIPTT